MILLFCSETFSASVALVCQVGTVCFRVHNTQGPSWYPYFRLLSKVLLLLSGLPTHCSQTAIPFFAWVFFLVIVSLSWGLHFLLPLHLYTFFKFCSLNLLSSLFSFLCSISDLIFVPDMFCLFIFFKIIHVSFMFLSVASSLMDRILSFVIFHNT